MVVGCGDDSDNGSGGSGGTAGTGGSGGGGSELSVQVLWGPVGPCEQGMASSYEVEVVPMNQDGEVTIVGSVGGCTGDIVTTEVNELDCPNNAPYPGTVTVTDEGGGMVSVAFTIEVCEDGSESS